MLKFLFIDYKKSTDLQLEYNIWRVVCDLGWRNHVLHNQSPEDPHYSLFSLEKKT